MTKYHKVLNEEVDAINRYEYLMFEIAINRRNGYYAVDKYENSEYRGTMFVGNYHETLNFLSGLRRAYWYMKPF